MPEHRPHIDAQTMERTILRLLETRGVGKTICPSEAARSASGSNDRSTWEPLMEMARCAANRLVSKGKLTILQQGRVVDGATVKGPIRLQLR